MNYNAINTLLAGRVYIARSLWSMVDTMACLYDSGFDLDIDYTITPDTVEGIYIIKAIKKAGT